MGEVLSRSALVDQNPGPECSDASRTELLLDDLRHKQ